MAIFAVASEGVRRYEMQAVSLVLSIGLAVGGALFQAKSTTEEAVKAVSKSKAPAVPPKSTDQSEEKTGTASKGKGKTEKIDNSLIETPKPVVRRKATATAQSVESRRMMEAEAKAKKLLEENARLQQEIAKRQGFSQAPISTADQALAELKAGNDRFATGKRVRTLLSSQDLDLREQLAKSQAPFAVIVTCSDSRLADNLLFDQELGRLFTIREAGNSPDIQGIASVEYAVEHLGAKLVVVLGHTGCGAIKAVAEAHGNPLPGNLWVIQASMAGLLESTPEDPNESVSVHMTHLSENNARRQAQVVLDRSEIVRHLVGSGKVKVVPAMYDLGSGRVNFMSVDNSTKTTEHK
jgi:carbonic anhydrase